MNDTPDQLTNAVRDLTAELQGQREAQLAEKANNDPRVAAVLQGLSVEQLQSERDARTKAGLSTAQIDQVLAAKNAGPADHTFARDMAAHAIGNLTPADFNRADLGEVGRTASPENVSKFRASAGSLVAAMRTDQALGVSIVERLARNASEMARLDASARQDWAAKQDAQLRASIAATLPIPRDEGFFNPQDQKAVDLRTASRERQIDAAIDQLKKDAAAALAMAGDHEYAKSLRDPNMAVSHDAWLIRTLANHTRMMALLKSKHPGKL